MPNFVPREYQNLICKHFVAHKRCAAWAPMGFGKTSATIKVLDALTVVDPSPALVIAPKKVARVTWPDEVQKWEDFKHLRVSTVMGDTGQRQRALKTPADLYTMNFEHIPWLVDHYGSKWPFRKIVVDEATKLRGFRTRQGTQRSKALAKIAHSRAEYFYELTGTPAPNGLKNLWGPAWFLDRGERLGNSYSGFMERWFKLGYDGFTVSPLPHAEKEILSRLEDICLSFRVQDWFDVEEPIRQDIYIDLPPKARRAYNEMEKQMFTKIREQGVEAFNAASRTTKCSQIANGAIYTDDKQTKFEHVHDSKLEALESIVEEANGMPVLVAYTYKHDLARLKKAFPFARVLDDKPATQRAWNEGKIPMLLAHPGNAGHGLNLQDGGNIIVYFSTDWDLELDEQILERIGPVRQMQSGYDRPVYVYRLLARDTVDEVKKARLESKGAVQTLIMEYMARRS